MALRPHYVLPDTLSTSSIGSVVLTQLISQTNQPGSSATYLARAFNGIAGGVGATGPQGIPGATGPSSGGGGGDTLAYGYFNVIQDSASGSSANCTATEIYSKNGTFISGGTQVQLPGVSGSVWKVTVHMTYEMDGLGVIFGQQLKTQIFTTNLDGTQIAFGDTTYQRTDSGPATLNGTASGVYTSNDINPTITINIFGFGQGALEIVQLQ